MSGKDLPTDLKAQIIFVSPGYTIYTAHGHCALRMQCPSMKLDYCFTYGLDDNSQSEMKFIMGYGVGTYSVVKTQDYLVDYKSQNRKVSAYNLNLTLSEKRDLWALLDKEVTTAPYRRYDYLRENCSSMVVRAVRDVLSSEQIEYTVLPNVLTKTYRDYVREISSNRPWVFFFWNTLLGADGEKNGALEDKLSPVMLVKVWSSAVLVDSTGGTRPMFTAPGETLLAGDDGSRVCGFTPRWAFGLLLVAVILISLLVRIYRKEKVARGLECFFLVFQTIVGLFLCFLTFFSTLPGLSGNLYVLVFNPIPVIAWWLFRKKKWYSVILIVYIVVLSIVILSTPFVPQFDLDHALLEETLLVVCIEAFWRMRSAHQTKLMIK